MKDSTLQMEERRGRKPKPDGEKFVLINGKVHPETRKLIESIAVAKDLTVSQLVRDACELLVKREIRKLEKVA